MDLIERYLSAIGRQLPAKGAADIMTELRDVLLSRVEEQEEELGRPLERAEVEALLVDFGHPLVVAGRYRKTQHLIGPEMFPFWWAGVKLMLSIVAGVYVVLIFVSFLTHQTPAQFNRSVPPVWYIAVYLFGVITLACALLERFGKTRIFLTWKPRNLPPAMSKPRSRFEVAAEMTMDIVFIFWWTGLIHFRDWMPDVGFLRVDMAPVWAHWYWPILAYAVLELAANAIAIARPAWVRVNAAILAGRYMFGIGIFAAILQAGRWLVVSSATIPPHELSLLQANFDLGMRLGISFFIAGMLVRIGLEAWRLWRFQQAMQAR